VSIDMSIVRQIVIPEGTVRGIYSGDKMIWNSSNKYTWKKLKESIINGTYTNDYVIGDTFRLDLGTEYGSVGAQIAAFDTDEKSDGTGKAPVTFVTRYALSGGWYKEHLNGILEQNEDGTYVIGTGTIGGYEASKMRETLLNKIVPIIPDETRNMMVAVSKDAPGYDAYGKRDDRTVNDAAWVLSLEEIGDLKVSTYEGLYKELFPDYASKIKTTPGSDNAQRWCLRSAQAPGTWNFVDTNGEVHVLDASYMAHDGLIVFGFCVEAK